MKYAMQRAVVQQHQGVHPRGLSSYSQPHRILGSLLRVHRTKRRFIECLRNKRGVVCCSVGKGEDETREYERQEGRQATGTKKSFQETEFALILAACSIGLLTGLGVVLFNDAVGSIRHVVWGDVSGVTGRELLEVQGSEWALRLALPPVMAGGLVGLITLISSSQTSSLKDKASWFDRLSRIGSSIVTLGGGASLGPEGPSVEIGRDVAEYFVDTLKSGKKHVASFVAAGSGAGVAAGFNAPISGVFFAVETVLQREEYFIGRTKVSQERESSGLTIAMVLLAAVLAAVVSQAGLGSSPAFKVPDYSLESFGELPLYFLFGSVCGIVSSIFLYSISIARDTVQMWRTKTSNETIPTIGLPLVGGLTTGIIALWYPEILYQGFDNVNSVLRSSGDYDASILMQIVVLKIIATSVCRGTGLKGGLYAPSIFIGASLGSAYGLICQQLGDAFGLTVSPPQAYALVGVGAILASACDVPLTSILLLFELTRDYLIILPALAAVGISYWVSSNWDLQGEKHQSNPAIMDTHGPNASAHHVDGGDLVIHVDDGFTISQILALCEAQNKRNVIVLNDKNNVSATIHKTE